MTIADAPDFLARLTVLAELFDAKFSDAKQQLYFETLSDIDLPELIAAMQEAARSCKFMPKPVELRELALGRDEDHAEDAWLQFRADMRRIGSYGAWDEVDQSVLSTVRDVFGGFKNACRLELTSEMWQARKKEFIRVYLEYERAERKTRALPPGTAPPKLLA